MSYPYVMTDTSVSVMVRGRVFNFTDSHPNWNSIRSAIRNRKWKRVETLTDIPRTLRKFSHGLVDVKYGEVFYKGEPCHNVIAQQIIRMLHEGAPFRPLVRFLDNLMKNPSSTAKDELYGFLEKGQLPITADGNFLAFKKVRDDYRSVAADPKGKHLNNAVGKTVRMPRAACDPDRNNTCSRGLHFCSRGYLNSFGGSRIVIVEINPKDVVAIPTDYQNQKGRACAYRVVGELGEHFTDEDMNKAVAKFLPPPAKPKKLRRAA